jgi:hypothetical protein
MAAYTGEPSYDEWDNEKQHPKNPKEKFSPEFLEYWFDPKNALTKTYHKEGIPVIEQLRQERLLMPSGAKAIGIPYSQNEMQEVWDKSYGSLYTGNHEKIPWISKIWARTSGFDTTLLEQQHPDAPWEKFS